MFRAFEVNSGDYLTKMIETRDRFPAVAAAYPKSDSLLKILPLNSAFIEFLCNPTWFPVKVP